MDEGLELPVSYKGKELLLPARLLTFGYSYKLEVEVNDQLVYFEPDEERNWRAIVDVSTREGKNTDPALLRAIAEVIETLTK